MEEVQKINPPTLSLSPDISNEPTGIKEIIPTPPQKTHVLLWIILGLVISFILAGTGTLVWKRIQTNQTSDKPVDLYISAPSPSVASPSATPIPTPTGETTTFTPPEITFEPKPYRNELARFEIQIPSGWQVDDNGKSGTIVVLIDPKTTLANESVILTFISVSVGTSRDTLENEVKTAKEGLLKSFDSYKIDEDQQMFLNGSTYHLLGGTYLAKGIKMRNRNLILIYNNRGYAIQAHAPESVWSKKELTLNASVFSFKNF